MYKSIRFWFLGFLLLCIPNNSLLAQDLTMVVSHWPPWTIVDTTTKPARISGIDVDIVRAIGNQLQLSLQLKQCPWKRCLAMMENGQADIATSLQKRPDREAYMHYFDKPYKTTVRRAFYVQKGKENQIQTYEDLDGKLIGLETGSKQFVRFDRDNSLKKYELPQPRQALDMLILGRLDTVVMTEVVGDYLIVTSGLSDKVGKAPYYHQTDSPAYIAVGKKSPFSEMMSAFNSVFETLVKSGQIDRIKAEYSAKYGLHRAP